MKSWDPFRDLLSIQDRMNKLFEAVLTGPVPFDAEGAGIGPWQPTAEVVATPDGLEISCDLPGLDRDQVEVQVEGNELVVSGERRRPSGPDERTWHLLERPFGRFLRRFELPPWADPESVEASLGEGVLRVRFARRPELRARRIPLGGEDAAH